jgi:putative tricarboxylic transport membrane protein
MSIVSEWSYFPSTLKDIITSPTCLLILLGGVALGYIIGVIPGLGPTMGMALVLGIVYKMTPNNALALLMGILVAAISSGGITACLANIPGTAAAAATCVDGYPLSQKGHGAEAVGYSLYSSLFACFVSMIIVFFIQPFIATIALKFGNWEVFLFCLFGLIICGSLIGTDPIRGWISAFLGVIVALVGCESIQSVQVLTFGIPSLMSGFSATVAILGLFGMGEVLYTLKSKRSVKVTGQSGYPKINWKEFARNKINLIRSLFAGLWVGFIPGIGESAACWFSYDLAKKGSKNKKEFGHGLPEGVIAAETANNASTVGALIPSLALGIPGSATTSVFIAALFLLGYRPGPTLMADSPGILCKITVLALLACIILAVVGYFLTRFAITFLTIDDNLLMPFIAIFCVVGAYASTYTMSSILVLLFFGLIGMLMKIYNYPIPPMLLGILIGKTMDEYMRRAMLQYTNNPLGLFTRPLGIGISIFLVVMIVLSFKTSKMTQKSDEEIEELVRESMEGIDPKDSAKS